VGIGGDSLADEPPMLACLALPGKPVNSAGHHHRKHETRDLLQTEKPIFFSAYEFDSLRFAGLTTDPEHLGEGFRDSDAGL
jgi:hypothetical protein